MSKKSARRKKYKGWKPSDHHGGIQGIINARKAPGAHTSVIPGEPNSVTNDEGLGLSFETRGQREAYLKANGLVDLHSRDLESMPARERKHKPHGGNYGLVKPCSGNEAVALSRSPQPDQQLAQYWINTRR